MYYKESTVILKSKILLPLILAAFSNFLAAQSKIEKYVHANTAKITAIAPDGSNYADLEVIGNAIGDRRIVMLGEQDHGDAPTFSAKTRLIKYLHEKKGFTVLAFEDDFFSTNYNWTKVQAGTTSIDSFIVKNINSMWTYCSTCFPLFKEYLPSTFKTGNPLKIAGFDSQMGSRFLLPLLDSVLHQLNIPVTQQTDYSTIIFPLLNSWYKYTSDSATTDKIIGYYKQIKTEMLAVLPANDFWIMTIENLIQQNYQFRNWKKNYWKDTNVRDLQMAANLAWLSETKYPDEKIIVWAHNYHISKYAGHYPEDFLNNAQTMGTFFTNNAGMLQKTYILGFTSYEGTAGRLAVKSQVYKVNKPGSNSLESWIDKSTEYGFIDFKKYNEEVQENGDAFYMSGSIKGNNHHTNHQAYWNKIFDGVFFIRKMYSCIN